MLHGRNASRQTTQKPRSEHSHTLRTPKRGFLRDIKAIKNERNEGGNKKKVQIFFANQVNFSNFAAAYYKVNG